MPCISLAQGEPMLGFALGSGLLFGLMLVAAIGGGGCDRRRHGQRERAGPTNLLADVHLVLLALMTPPRYQLPLTAAGIPLGTAVPMLG